MQFGSEFKTCHVCFRDLDLIIELETEWEKAQERILSHQAERRKWKDSIILGAFQKAKMLIHKLPFALLSTNKSNRINATAEDILSLQAAAQSHNLEIRKGKAQLCLVLKRVLFLNF